MKKIIYTLLSLALLVACGPVTPPVGPDPENDSTLDNMSLLAAHYFAQDGMRGIDGDQVEVDMMFRFEDQNGNGYALKVKYVTDKVDKYFMPSAGKYPLDSTLDAMTIIAGYDDYIGTEYEGMSVQGSLFFPIRNGELDGSYDFIKDGYALISGDTNHARIEMHFKTPDGYEANCLYDGALYIEDNSKKEVDRYTKEPTETSEINFTGESCKISYEDNVFYLTLTEAGSDRQLRLGCTRQADNSITGSFTVGSTPTDNAPGTIQHSYGIENYICYLSFLGTFAGDSIDPSYGVYFITGGSMTISQNDNTYSLTGSFTTYWGSTIILTYNGTFTE